MMTPPVDQEFVQVAVPARHVMAVYRLLTELEQQPGADIEPAGTNDAPAAWDANKLTRLASTELSNTDTVSRILDILCQEPGKQYDMQDLVEALPMEYHTLRGNLAAFTRHLKKHYDSAAWPMQVDWRGDEALYSLSPETAALWSSIRG
ncbi:hypothetical protein K8Z49_33350 [Actinomadura madurae]|uniref:hypothetical protein n=1 Tax=Actinomadura madurae TaxID=1993 RepID=UPI00399B9239